MGGSPLFGQGGFSPLPFLQVWYTPPKNGVSMTLGTLKINTEKLLPIIKKWLYSDKDIFVRELVSNACDAIAKLKILSDAGEALFKEEEAKISITLNKEEKTLTFGDTGIGMTAEEVETYIAQLAFSGAEEFLQKYEGAKGEEQVIGHFGLGFYSAYMAAHLVEIQTKSYKEGSAPAFWSCDGSTSYTIEEGIKEERGTEIILHIEDEAFLETAKIRSILDHYCAFLPYPIYLNGEHINQKKPLYLKSPSSCTDEEYKAFFKQLHPAEPDPIFWVHLNVDFPFHLKGILYFPKIDRQFDFQKSPVKLFCNRVFVSDSCRDLIPDYLSIMRGAIDSPDIPLNVSRSYLQMDQTVRSLSSHISKKVADRLTSLYKTDREAFLRSFEEIDTILKLGALQDEKFYTKIKELLVWKTVKGDYLTAEEAKEKGSTTLFYTQDPNSPFLHLYTEKGIDVLIASGPLDVPLMNFLEAKGEALQFQRIDGGIDEAILDKAKEKTLLGPDGRSEAATIAERVRTLLNIEGLEVEAKSLSSKTLPSFLLIEEQGRRLRDTFSMQNREMPKGLFETKTFIVNTNSPLVEKALAHADGSLTEEVFQYLYQLSLLSQKELPAKELPQFIELSTRVLEKLLAKE